MVKYALHGLVLCSKRVCNNNWLTIPCICLCSDLEPVSETGVRSESVIIREEHAGGSNDGGGDHSNYCDDQAEHDDGSRESEGVRDIMVHTLFRELDIDGDGYLGVSEVSHLCTRLGLKLATATQCAEIIRQIRATASPSLSPSVGLRGVQVSARQFTSW